MRGGRLGVINPEAPAQVKGRKEHDDEVHEQRDGDPHDVEREHYDVISLQREHNDDGIQQGEQRHWPDLWNKTCLVPFAPFELQPSIPRQHPCNKGDAEIDGHRLCDLSDRHVDHGRLLEDAQPLRQYRDEEVGVGRVEEYLKDGVESDKCRCIFRIAAGETVPTMTIAMRGAMPMRMSPTIYSG